MPLLCDNAGPILQYHFHNEIVSLIRNGLKTLKQKKISVY